MKNSVLIVVLLLSLAVANKTGSKAHHKARFDKKSNKERYRVESENSA